MQNTSVKNARGNGNWPYFGNGNWPYFA